MQVQNQADSGKVHGQRSALSRDARAEVVLITPAMAQELLLMNTFNRPLSAAKVAKYAALMKAGAWAYNGEGSISISRTGKLLNGQHRLHAIVNSGVACLMVIAHGVLDSAFATIDAS